MASPRGRETLQWMTDNDVTLAPAEGSGTYYDPESNTMYIASSADGSSAIHEASHAQWDAEGTRADATKVSQEDYVRSQIDNEVDATTEGIYYDKEMRMRGYPVEQSAAAAESLKQQSAALMALIAQFKLADGHPGTGRALVT